MEVLRPCTLKYTTLTAHILDILNFLREKPLGVSAYFPKIKILHLDNCIKALHLLPFLV